MTHPVIALVKKNLLIKKSRPWGLVFELLLPLTGALLLAWFSKNLKNVLVSSPDHFYVGEGRWPPYAAVALDPPNFHNAFDFTRGPTHFHADYAELRKNYQGHQALLDLSGVAKTREVVMATTPFVYTGYLVKAALEWVYYDHNGRQRGANDAAFSAGSVVDRSMKETLVLELTTYCLIVFFAVSVSLLSSVIVEERANRLREVMKIQGVKDWHFYVSWFITYASIYLLEAVGVAVIIVNKVNKEIPFILLFTCLWLFLLASAALVLAITSVFDSPKLGTLLGAVAYIFVGVTGVLLPEGGSVAAQVPKMFVPHYAMVHFLRTTGRAKQAGSTVTVSGLFDTVDGRFNAGVALVMLFVDLILFNLAYLYIERVVSHEFGQSLPWYFPFTREYWMGAKIGAESAEESIEGAGEDLAIQEGLSSKDAKLVAENAVVQFKHMTKVFNTDGVKLRAVDDVSLTMFPSEILCLLGANSAGKSTLTSMLLGLVEPTSGSGNVLGLDSVKQQTQIRKLTGYCPQQDVLWPDLTVLQHMELFGSVRGLGRVHARQQALDALDDPVFKSKANTKVKNLSGGMKRKLCTMLAFMGQTKFVILDEPTSGLDPFSRRALWDYLKVIKAGRVVCLTTHFMDEAELLGDRVAILALGRIHAYGSQLFLKQAFQCGYALSIQRATASDDRILAAIASLIPAVELKTRTHSELNLQVPLDAKDKLKDVFALLDSQRDSLQIENYSVTGAKLEDVFLKIASLFRAGVSVPVSDSSPTLSGMNSSAKLSGASLVVAQIKAVMVSRLYASYRNLSLVLFGFMIPVLLVSLGAIIPGLIERSKDLQEFGTLDFNANLKILYIPDSSLDSFFQTMPGKKLQADLEEVANVKSFAGTNDLLLAIVSYLSNSDIVPDKLREVQRTKEVDAVISIRNGYGPRPSSGGSIDPNLAVGLLILNPNELSKKDGYALIAKLVHITNEYRWGSPLASEVKIRLDQWPVPVKEWTRELVRMAGIFLVCFGCAFFGPVVGLNISNERLQGVKFQQFVSGLRVETYWLGNYLMDLFMFMCFSLLTIGIISIFSKTSGVFGLFGILMLFGSSTITLTYTISTVSMSAMGTFWIAIGINIVSLVMSFVWGLFRAIDDIEKSFSVRESGWLKFSNTMNSWGVPFPAAHLLEALVVRSEFYKDRSWSSQYTSHSWRCLLVITPVLLVLPFLIDYVLYNLVTRRKAPVVGEAETALDQEAVPILAQPQPRLEVVGVRKTFGSLRAVNGVTFECAAGEVLGLLGTNSAGKTTSVKMAIGFLAPDAGAVYIDGIHVHSNLVTVRSLFGYCGQQDAVFNDLTVLEHLRYYAALKGVMPDQITSEIDESIRTLGIEAFANTRAGRLSGGNKRKLSLAIAVIGRPSLLFLDEPSSGMDPLSQRFMWGIIRKLASSDRSIVLTTHSMEEAEAVSNRVGIMMTGAFKCVGTVQEIKSTYGSGYEVSVRSLPASKAQLDAIIKVVEARTTTPYDADADILPSAGVLVSEQFGLADEFVQQFQNEAVGAGFFVDWLAEHQITEAVYLHLKASLNTEAITQVDCVGVTQKLLISSQASLASIFQALEAAKVQSLVDDYGVTQFTLEQIFNSFAREEELKRVSD